MAGVGRPKGGPKYGGRKKGSRNKVTASLVEAIDTAFTQLGGAKWLKEQAQEQPQAFMQLLGKRIPRDLKLGGDAQILVTVVTGVPPSEAD
jgi:hypothetical protein